MIAIIKLLLELIIVGLLATTLIIVLSFLVYSICEVLIDAFHTDNDDF